MNIKSKGQGSIIIFVMFIVIILIIVGSISALNQTKSITKSTYDETSLRTNYIAISGIQEALATRFIPSGNIYAIEKKLETDPIAQQISSINPEFFNNLTSSYPAGALSPVFPKSGYILKQINPPAITQTNFNNYVMGTYVYKVYGGKAINNKTGSKIGMPTNNLTNIQVYSVGYSLDPSGNLEKVAAVANVDTNRFDKDSFNADEVETMQIITDKAGVNNIEQNFVKPYDNTFGIDRFVAYQKRGIYFDAVSDSYRDWSTQSNTISTGSGITADFTSSKLISLSNTLNSQPMFRIIFNRPIDIRTLSAGTTFPICESSSPTTCVDFQKVILFPASDTIILFPVGALLSGKTYQFTLSNIRDYEGNLLQNITLSFSVS